MKSVRATAGPLLTRGLGVFWAVVVTIAAVMQMFRAWNALISGQLKIPLLHSSAPVVRTSEPFWFHGGLLLLLLIAVTFAYVAIKAWQNCMVTREAGRIGSSE